MTPVTASGYDHLLRDFYVGAYPGTNHGQDAKWAEFRAYDGNMGSTQISSILNELASKWGLDGGNTF